MTITRAETLERVLKQADPNRIPDALRKVDLGAMLTPRKVTFAALTAAAAVDITTAAAAAAATVAPALPSDVLTLPAILSVTALRVTAVGTGATGARIVTDSGGTAGAPGANGPGIALLSDDGKTLTFEGTVTGFVLEYVPRPAIDPTTTFAT